MSLCVEVTESRSWVWQCGCVLTGTNAEQEKQESEKMGGTERPVLLRAYRYLSVFSAPFQFLSYATAGKTHHSKTQGKKQWAICKLQ